MNEIKDRKFFASSSISSCLVSEGINAVKKIAKISVITRLAIGVVEIVSGFYC